jgi:hypothetical protein
MPKINDEFGLANRWRFLVIEGDANTNEFKVLDYTDNEGWAEEALDRHPEASVYALVKVETVTKRTFA